MSAFSKYVADRSVAQGACRIWRGGTSLGRPMSGTTWYETQDVRKAVVRSTGRVLAPGEVVEPSCGVALCVSAAHLGTRRHRRGRPQLGLSMRATVLLERWEREKIEGRLTLERIAQEDGVPVTRVKRVLRRRRLAQDASTAPGAARVRE